MNASALYHKPEDADGESVRLAASHGPLRGSGEELLNGVTHAAGAVLSLIGSLVLLHLAADRGTVVHVLACATYAASLVTLYVASTFYHLAQDQALKRLLRIVDHVCIFLVIAGSYTPLSLVPLGGPSGWALLVLVWAVAATGTILKATAAEWAYGHGSTLMYAATCSLGLPLLPQIIQASPEAAVCAVVGGVAYAVGLIFFVQDEKPYYHTIWHLFVLVGSACHYYAIFLSVIPSGA